MDPFVSKFPVFRDSRRLWTLVLALSFSLAFAILVFGWYLAERQTNEHYQSLRSLGKAIATASADLMANKNYSDLNRILLRTIDGPEIFRVQVIDKEGWMRAHVYKPKATAPQLGIQGVKITPPKYASRPVEFEEMALKGLTNPGSESKWLSIWYPIQTDKFLGWVYVNGSIKQAESSKPVIVREAVMAALTIIAITVLARSLYFRYKR